jgi:hypothetical protein
MQKMLLSFITVFIAVVSYAQKANMVFFTPNEEKFYLVVNGIQQNGQPMANVKITEMNAPMVYNVRIRFEDSKMGIINDKVSLEPGTEKSWSIQSKKKKGTNDIEYVIKTAGEIVLNEVATPDNSLPQAQTIVYHTEPLPVTSMDGVSINMNVNEQGGNVSFNMGTQGTTTTSTSTTVTTQTTGAPVMTGNCANPMDAITFRQQLDRVRSQGTAAGKKIVAEKIAQASCLTSHQVYELCDALYMNNDKLALAKYCYTRCYNPQNYEEVYKALPTSSMVKELDDYVVQTGQPVRQNPTTTTTTNVPVIRDYVPGYSGPYGCTQPMSSATFTAAKSSIQDADFEATKMSTAKTIVGANCITTDQLIEICNLFDFENSKLEFAKFAYTKTYDKGNYFKVNKVFDFDASKQELNKFIQGK